MIRALLLSVGLLAVACTPELDTIGGGTPPPGDFLVPVDLREFEIEIAETPPAGELSFQIENHGDQRHGFAIEGNGINETLATEILPGQTVTATIALEPGTYTVWCPIGDHRQRGMEAELVVEEGLRTEGPPDPLGDDAVVPSEQEDEIEDEGN